jgi:hypothetical protein
MPPFTLSIRRPLSVRRFRARRVLISLGAILFVGAQLRAEIPESRCKACPGCQQSAENGMRQIGAWKLADTEDFCVCCAADTDPAVIGKACESLRRELAQKWLGEEAANRRWTARCYVVVHPTTESYLREVGAGGQNTLGSSLIRTDKRQVISRRIDIRGDVAAPIRAALPHEMTHVVLADAFAGDELPRWADEGMAMLADPAEKLAGHSRDLNAAIAEHREFRLGELFVKSDYPLGEQRAVFYGESASLVAFLASRRQPSQLVGFFHRASREGYDAALREVYGIHDPAQLERLWRLQANFAADSSNQKREHTLN